MRFFIAILALGCASSSGEEWVQVDPPSFSIPAGDTDLPTCGAAELCARSIDECAVTLTPPECEAWYDSGQCADIDAYTACNCDCNEQPTCDGYFACGEICFDDHC